MTVANTLIFTGSFSDSPIKTRMGKTLYIPLTQTHPAFTLKINGWGWDNTEELSSFSIKFSSPQEREIVAACDYTGEIFFIEP